MIKINLARPRIQLAICRISRREQMEWSGSPIYNEYIKYRLRKAGFDMSKPYRWCDDVVSYHQLFWQRKGDQNEKQRDTEAKGRRFNLLHRMSKIRV